jgi:hypothetical protein
MYVRPTTEPLLRLVAAEKCTPHLASQPSREYYTPNLNKDNPDESNRRCAPQSQE